MLESNTVVADHHGHGRRHEPCDQYVGPSIVNDGATSPATGAHTGYSKHVVVPQCTSLLLSCGKDNHTFLWDLYERRPVYEFVNETSSPRGWLRRLWYVGRATLRGHLVANPEGRAFYVLVRPESAGVFY